MRNQSFPIEEKMYTLIFTSRIHFVIPFIYLQFVNTPICCPSRSSILTGKYPHNIGVFNNSLAGNCSSEYWQKHHEPHSIAAILKHKANYTTFYGGKYLNQVSSEITRNKMYIDYYFNKIVSKLKWL